MKQLEVQIMGQSYLLGCPENGDAQMLDAVNRVDMAMCKIRDAGKIRARDRIAVLAALNLAFELAELSSSAIAAPKSRANASTDAIKSAEDPQLTLLMHRLDAALGVDGQLL